MTRVDEVVVMIDIDVEIDDDFVMYCSWLSKQKFENKLGWK